MAQPELFDLGIRVTYDDQYPDTPRDEVGRAIYQTMDGGFAIMSTWWEPEGASFHKINDYGIQQHQMNYYEDPGNDPWSIHEVNNLANETANEYVYVGANTRHRRAIIVKLAMDGTEVWGKRILTDSVSEARCVEVFEGGVENGNFILVGFEHDLNYTHATHMLLACYNTFGVMQWSHRINAMDYYDENVWEIADLRGYSIRQTGEDEFVVTGSATMKKTTFSAPVQGPILFRFSSNGTALTLLDKHIYENDDFISRGMDVCQTCDGGFLITGTAESVLSAPRTDGLVIKTDAGGLVSWSTIIGDLAHDEELYAVEETREGGVMVAGRHKDASGTQERITAMRFDDLGNVDWIARLNKAGWSSTSMQGAFDMERTFEDTYALVGYMDEDGLGPIEPYTYVVHMDDNLSRNQEMCFFEQPVGITEQGALSHSPISYPQVLNGPEDQNLEYVDFILAHDWFYGCERKDIYPPLFQFHFDNDYDRAYGGVKFRGVLPGKPNSVRQYALTGSVSSDLAETDPHMPLVIHRENGDIISNNLIKFQKTVTEYHNAIGYDIQSTSLNGLMLAGKLISEISGGGTDENAVVVTLDYDGTPLWAKSVGRKLAGYDESFAEVQAVPTAASIDGDGWIAAGYTSPTGGARQALVTKFNPSGNITIANAYEIALRDYTEATCVCPVDDDGDGVADNGFIVAGHSRDMAGNPGQNGYTDRDIVVIRLNSGGNVVWAKSYSVGDCWANSIIPTDDDDDDAYDDGFILCGASLDGSDYDALVMKIDPTGTVDWIREYDRSDNDQAMSITQMPDGSFSLTGITDYYDAVNSVDYGPQVYVVHLSSGGVINKSHAAVGSQQPTDCALDCGYDIDALSDGTVHIAGSTCSSNPSFDDPDMYSIKAGENEQCEMIALDDESVATPTPQIFTHNAIDPCNSGGTLCQLDVSGFDQWKVEQAVVKELSMTPYILCRTNQLCIPTFSKSTHFWNSPEDEETGSAQLLGLNPNPVSANSMLTVKLDEMNAEIPAGSTFTIHDISGRNLLETSVNSAQPEHLLPIGDWPAGVYILTLQAPDGRSSAIKFVVE